MAKGNKTNTNAQMKQGYDSSVTAYNQSLTPSPFENQLVTNAGESNIQNKQDYSNIMGGYQNFMNNMPSATKFSYNPVSVQRPAELGEGYGYMREAVPGYRDFAQTGGYSDKDIQELRARGVSPIRSAYGNAMMEMDRARSIGGNGGAPNYIAAMSKAQREMPQQMADATTNVNAGLADAIRQGKLSGLAGLSGIGGTMGNLASAESGRMLQADLANQSADIQTQGMGESSLQNRMGANLSALSGQSSLYGTTPGLSNMFGNQALQAQQQRQQQQQVMLQAQAEFSKLPPEQKTPAMWKKIVGAAAAGAAVYFTAGAAAPAAAGIYAGIAGGVGNYVANS